MGRCTLCLCRYHVSGRCGRPSAGQSRGARVDFETGTLVLSPDYHHIITFRILAPAHVTFHISPSVCRQNRYHVDDRINSSTEAASGAPLSEGGRRARDAGRVRGKSRRQIFEGVGMRSATDIKGGARPRAPPAPPASAPRPGRCRF
ncbi:hypothetical protein EVAR_66174_1 [Eumeta japonica]|uniref:Uncharacterized protein n=1 Tax=Eumeta variegata TaxID=151549 RepID=A0A4C1ZNK5_EUMVA|nr:hypothetical protein EVAR_66174_1 [Eumeta japonica]